MVGWLLLAVRAVWRTDDGAKGGGIEQRFRERRSNAPMVANLGYVKVVPPVDLNKNTEFRVYGLDVWTSYILSIFIGWLLMLFLLDCSPGEAWTAVNLTHFTVTYGFFNCIKGTPFGEDQGMYDKLIGWEQLDNGRHNTCNHKFLTVVPIILYMIALHTTGYIFPSFMLTTIAFIVLLAAKTPYMHRVRTFGINSD